MIKFYLCLFFKTNIIYFVLATKTCFPHLDGIMTLTEIKVGNNSNKHYSFLQLTTLPSRRRKILNRYINCLPQITSTSLQRTALLVPYIDIHPYCGNTQEDTLYKGQIVCLLTNVSAILITSIQMNSSGTITLSINTQFP